MTNSAGEWITMVGLSIAGLLTFLEATRRHDLARHHIARSVFRFARVQLVSRLFAKSTIVPFVNETSIRTAAGYTGANGNYYWGLFEPHDMAFVLHYLRPGDLFVDAGANVGSYTILASGAAGCRTVAFEPVPSTIARLRMNVADNGIADRVDIRPFCLGAQGGDVRFTTHADTMNRVVSDSSTYTIDVPVRRLDDQLVEPPRLVKIDTEGFDDNVLLGCEGLLKAGTDMAILIETLGGAHSGRSPAEVQTWLSEYGFQPVGYDLFGRRIVADGASGTQNFLFVRGVQRAQFLVSSAPKFLVPGFLEI